MNIDVDSGRLRRRLLAWFARAKRDLPWRQTRDPYRIWVSEIMLQQTQVATVIPFFHRFVKAFPDVASLAAAREAEVLRAWEGLGYYRRARNLHRAAKVLARENRGRVPDDPHGLGVLPGVGRYTLGAILSQAFDRRLPILEANSVRVLCRLFVCRGDPKREPLKKKLWAMAEKLLPRRRVGDFNQALMELGALICTPRRPSCERCPLAGLCAAHAQGVQNEVPLAANLKEIIEVAEVAVVIRRGNEVLLVQRPRAGRWAGLWEFPHGPIAESETPAGAAVRLVRELTGLRVRLGASLAVVRHSITRYRVTITCFEARFLAGRFRSRFYSRAAWVRPSRLDSYPLSSPQRRLAGACRGGATAC